MTEKSKVMDCGTQPVKSGTLCSATVRPEFRVKIPISPMLLDDFILNRERRITIGRHKHKFFVEKYLQNGGRVNFDLDQGLSTYDPRPQDEGLNQILQYIIWNSEQTDEQDLKKVIKKADVVCWRGAITKMAATPYEDDGVGWKFVIDKFEDTLFLNDMDTDTKIANMEKQSEWEKKCTYWGHKFETFIMAEKEKDPTPDEPVSTWEEMGAAFFTVFPGSAEAREAEIKVFYAAEMDGLDSNNKHVEVKTQAHGLWVGRYFQKKAMKWWIQSHIVGIEYIVVGIRNNKGIVSKLEKLDMEVLKKRCTEWNGNVCLRAFQHIINQVRIHYDKLVKPDQLLIIERKPNERIISFQVIPRSSMEILSPVFRERFSKSESQFKRKSEDDDEVQTKISKYN